MSFSAFETKMKPLLLLACLAVAVQAGTIDEWHRFKIQYKKDYANGDEEQHRMNIFFSNQKKIAEHNAKYEQGTVKYHLKMNQLGDMTVHEFRSIYNGFNKTRSIPINGVNPRRTLYEKPLEIDVPAQIDWRDKGAVTGVKNQGQCGSCWAFSTTGSLEGQNFLKTNKLVSLSEQNLVDCSGKYGNEGCNGGLMDQAFSYIADNGGIDTEESYPYEAEDDQCRFQAANVGATDKGFVDIPSGDEDALKTAVATIGPIAVAIDASQFSFQFYSGGVYDEEYCSSTSLDHGVLAVGYGTDGSDDYWLVKNSWGDSWGLDGYIKMSRNKENQCGIATSASYPRV